MLSFSDKKVEKLAVQDANESQRQRSRYNARML